MSLEGQISIRRLLVVTLVGFLASSALAGQEEMKVDFPSDEAKQESLVVLGTAQGGELVIQPHLVVFTSGSREIDTSPIVGEPVCTKFVTPCPEAAKQEAFQLDGKGGWLVALGKPETKKEASSLPISIHNSSGLKPQVLDVGQGWLVEGPEAAEAGKWAVRLSLKEKTPVVGDPGGCWIEVKCPEKSNAKE